MDNAKLSVNLLFINHDSIHIKYTLTCSNILYIIYTVCSVIELLKLLETYLATSNIKGQGSIHKYGYYEYKAIFKPVF